MTETLSPSQIAFKAADYMAEHGNCKHTLIDEAGRVCLEGAVRMAAFGEIAPADVSIFQGNVSELWWYLSFLIRGDYPHLRAGRVSFNDDLAEGPEHVLLLLKRAGRDLEEQGR